MRLEAAFPPSLAEECVQLLWPKIGCHADLPHAWIRPVIRCPSWDAAPFTHAVNTSRLHASFDQLVGRGRWRARRNPGLFVIRFPSQGDPGDAGWHIDGSFDVGGEWWVNLRSRGRALLMLFLFTDVGPDDAPTRILVGSHLDVPPVLEPLGEGGVHFENVMPSFPDVDKAGWRSPRATLATFTYAIRSWCTPRVGRIGEPNRASWPSLSYRRLRL